jgi:nucleotidyltransferase/DNA polymerase involved in DNA repair
MIFHTSNKVFIHVDCDSFFASCEVLKNPSLKWKYVCVGHEIIIASTYNCKKLWVTTWTPIWEARKILKNKWIFLWLDHAYYSEISDKVFKYLRENTLSIEPFSIDEAFCEITWLPEYYSLSLEDFVKKIQKEILDNIWIAVSIWCAETHIKAKIYSKINKPFWIYIWFDKDREIELFKKLDVSKIPFIWRKHDARLHNKAPTIYDFLKLWFWYLKNEIWKHATDLWLELLWVNAFVVKRWETSKSISRSRSFNKNITNNKDFLLSQAKVHFERLFEEITDKNIEIKHISLLLRTKEFKTLVFESKMPEFTNERQVLFNNLITLFEKYYDENILYRSVWVIMSDFRNYLPRQISIFDTPKKSKEIDYNLAKTINRLNDKFWNRKIWFWVSLIDNNERFKLWFRK